MITALNFSALVATPSITDQLYGFCQRWHVRRLALFGSINTDHFSEVSDVDVLVSFSDDNGYTLFDLMKMNGQLELIFGRRVDLLTYKAVEEDPNHFRRDAILASAKVVYELTALSFGFNP